MKVLITSAIFLLLVAYLIHNGNQQYEAGYAAERPLEMTIRTQNCITRAEMPAGYPYMGMNGVFVTFVLNEYGEEIPVKVCPGGK